jgi:4a-hydroxytetrahydrobiopterin dehydratase
MNTTLKQKSCSFCKKGVSPLSNDLESDFLNEVPSWFLDRSHVHRLKKRFDFNGFVDAVEFFKAVTILAEQERHHPLMCVDYRTVSIELTTHTIHGLSENDFIMAAKIDGIYSKVTDPVHLGILESAML